MTDHKSDPRRRCLKLEYWPSVDRAAWLDAIAYRGLLEVGGAAASWRNITKKAVLDSYGRWLTFLELNGWLDENETPAERFTEDRLRSYITDLEVSVAPITCRNRITNLSEALRVMAPEMDQTVLRRARARLKTRARPVRNKHEQIVPADHLLRLGFDLMRRAEHEDAPRQVWRAAMYRDGLTIAILACRPIRRRNLASMRLDYHLSKRGTSYYISFSSAETKNRRTFDQPLSPHFTEYIDRYVQQFRPLLLSGKDSDRVWISWRAQPMSDASLYGAIISRTKTVFGVGIPPHRFRDNAVTTLSRTHPASIHIAKALLHHSDYATSETYYNQARDTEAVRAWHTSLRELRRK